MLHFIGKETEAQRLNDLFKNSLGGSLVIDLGLKIPNQSSFLFLFSFSK